MKKIDQKIAAKTRKELEETKKIQSPEGDPKVSALLTKQQRIKKNRDATKFEKWFWSQSILKIGFLVTFIFYVLTFTSTKYPFLGLILNSLEPLGVLLAVLIFIRETPERRKQFHYQALSTIDRAAGIRNSKARIIALQDLVDQGINLDELDLGNANLEEIELNGVEIKNGNFMGSNLKKAEMHLANLQKGNFKNTQGHSFKIRFGNLSFSDFTNSNFSNADFSSANLMFANFNQTKLSGAKFINAKLKGAKFTDAFLSGADFTGADVNMDALKKANLINVILPDGTLFKE
ncbi:MAG: pentapeptide repeat-containing protein [Flavobacteriaceae bacterium]